MSHLGTPPIICLITEGKANPENYQTQSSAIIETARSAIRLGVNMIQVREKQLGGRMLFDLSRRLVESIAGTGALILVNDRADVAAAAGADGVHLPEAALPADAVRSVFPDLLIGVSTHSLASARSAVAAGADYILFGPIFETPGKGQPTGLDMLSDICRELGTFPVLALGGIDDTNCSGVVAAGASGIGAIRSLNDPETCRRICR